MSEPYGRSGRLMALNVVSEQAVPARPLASELSSSEPVSGPAPHQGTAWFLIALVALARWLLDLAWGAGSGLEDMDFGPERWLRLLSNVGFVFAAVGWCRRMGGGVLAMVATSVAITAAPGLWNAGWQLSGVSLIGLWLALSLPLLLRNQHRRVLAVALSGLFAVLWLVLVDKGTLQRFGAGDLFVLGFAQLVAAGFVWCDLALRWGLPVREPRTQRSLPVLIKMVGLWIAITSVISTYALLGHRDEALVVASLWLAVPFGLAIELLRRRPLGRAMAWFLLLGLVLQLGVVGWILVQG